MYIPNDIMNIILTYKKQIDDYENYLKYIKSKMYLKLNIVDIKFLP